MSIDITIPVIKYFEYYPCPDTYNPSPGKVSGSKEPTGTQCPDPPVRPSRQEAGPQRRRQAGGHSQRRLPGREEFWVRLGKVRKNILGQSIVCMGHEGAGTWHRTPPPLRAKAQNTGTPGDCQWLHQTLDLNSPLKAEKEEPPLNPWKAGNN